jgi:hypothetical protein
MWLGTPRVGVEMESNVSASERTPRLVIALAAGVAAALAPGLLLKSILLAGATAMMATVATGYCPINAALTDRELEAPHWRTLKTYRVEP